MISGIVNVTVYAKAVRYLYPVAGLVDGTLSSFAGTMISGYFPFRFINRSVAPSCASQPQQSNRP